MLLSDYITYVFSNRMSFITFILISGVILVNGWTDAPTAVATCISTRSQKPKNAIMIAALMNFSGVYIMSSLGGRIVDSISNIAYFGNNPQNSSTALCAAMASIVIWAVAAWYFGIPTSESHALVAGLAGAAIALNKNFDSINTNELTKVFSGLIISAASGLLLGYIFAKLTQAAIKNLNREKTDRSFSVLQNISASFMAFMHGAQDGQKFIAVLLLTSGISKSQTSDSIPVWAIIYCSTLMALGTSVGGMRIIKSMGMDMVKLKKYQGFSADLAGSASLLAATLTGIPVSTTHTKTCAIMGVGAAKNIKEINPKIVKEMAVAWILTFPACGFLGYLMTILFLKIR